MADKLNSSPPDNPTKVGDVIICEQTFSNAAGPEKVWSFAYATEVDDKGMATEVRIAGYARPTKMKDLRAQLWVISDARQPTAQIIAARLRITDNKFPTADAIKAEIRNAEKLVPVTPSAPTTAPVEETASP